MNCYSAKILADSLNITNGKQHKNLKEDLTGRIFGRLTVIKRFGSTSTGESTWLCKCICGSERINRRSVLIHKRSQSCGCYNRDLCAELGRKSKIEPGLSGARKLFREYQYHAANRNLLFDLSFSQFSQITKFPCFYCGKIPQQISSNGSKNSEFVYNGIDRLYNKKGYSFENCAPCCKDCNFLKRDLDYDKFLEKIYTIAENRGK